MPGLQDIPGAHVLRARVPAEGTAGNDDTWTLGRLPNNAQVTSARWIPDAAVTGAATNNFQLQVINKGAAGSGTTTVTAAKTYASGTNSAAAVAESLTLSSTASDLLANAGDILALVRTHNGSGLAGVAGTVEVGYLIR